MKYHLVILACFLVIRKEGLPGCFSQSLPFDEEPTNNFGENVSNPSRCLDRKGQWVEHGDWYLPDPDPCMNCECVNGKSGACMMPSCAAPNCDFISNPDVCCDFTCTSTTGTVKISCIVASTLVLLGLLLGTAFAMYRLRQKRRALLSSLSSPCRNKTGLQPTSAAPNKTLPSSFSKPVELEVGTPPPSYHPPSYDDALREGDISQTPPSVPDQSTNQNV